MRLFWYLPRARMLEQVSPVGTRSSASSPKIASAHLWSVQFWPRSPFLVRGSCRVKDVEGLVLAGAHCQHSAHGKPRMCCIPHCLFVFCCAQSMSQRSYLPKRPCWDAGQSCLTLMIPALSLLSCPQSTSVRRGMSTIASKVPIGWCT